MYNDILMTIAPLLIYFFGILSPGPANLAITQVALEMGMKPALLTSFGVVVGSITWGLLTFFGLAQAIQKIPFLIITLSLVGSFYMLWLAYSNFKKFCSKNNKTLLNTSVKKKTNYFFHGLMIHLTNPKGFLVWSIVFVSAFDPTNERFILSPYLILIFCACIALAVCTGYALLFSHPKMSALYDKYSRYTHLFIGLIFIFVSTQILLQTITLI